MFLGNKLVSCDAILPVLMELQAETRITNLRVISLDATSYDAICQNRVLHEGILEIGSFELMGRRRKSVWTWLLHRMRAAWMLSGLLASVIRGRIVLMHFKALNQWPLRMLFWISPAATVLCEGTAAGYGETEQKIAGLTPGRNAPNSHLAAGTLFYFSDGWAPLSMPNYRNLPRARLPNPYRLTSWGRYVQQREAGDFDHVGLSEPEPVIVYLLGWFGELAFLAGDNAARELFEETLAILTEEGGGHPVVIKPHVISDMSFVSKTIENANSSAKALIRIAHLHPSVLARRASLFVANYFSTALLPAASVGVPTVEYSRYSAEALRITDGGSMRPDIVSHFINGDAGLLRALVRDLAQGPRRLIDPPAEKLSDEVLAVVSGGRAASLMDAA